MRFDPHSLEPLVVVQVLLGLSISSSIRLILLIGVVVVDTVIQRGSVNALLVSYNLILGCTQLLAVAIMRDTDHISGVNFHDH